MIKVSRYLEDQKIYRRPDAPEQPRVSVVLPSWRIRPGNPNRRAIDSVLRQTMRDFELIILDDGSNDGLFDFLMQYQKQDARIIVVRHDTNSGLHSIRINEGLMLARGKYIAYQFEDDEWLPEALEALLEPMEDREDQMVYGIAHLEITRPGGRIDHIELGNEEFSYARLSNDNCLANNAVLHPRSIIDRCGMYDPHILLRRICDHDLWLRYARVYPVRKAHQQCLPRQQTRARHDHADRRDPRPALYGHRSGCSTSTFHDR